MKAWFRFATLLLAAALAAPAHAVIVVYVANLRGTNEAPPNASASPR
jgi:hypothetical protein